MSSSKSQVTVSIANRQGEVGIIDGDFRVVREGIGQVTENLSPGIYKARARVGTEYQDRLFVVEPDAPAMTIEVEPVRFASALPLHFTSTSHEYHQEAIKRAINTAPVDIGLGTGAKLLIFVRDPSDANKRFARASDAARRNYERAFEGFRLRSASGTLLADVDEVGQTALPDGYKLLHVQASAEPRVLTLERDGMPPLAMPLPTVSGWQTQLFVNVDVPPGLDTVGKPLLADRSVMMAPMGFSFYPSDEYLRLTEVARAALQAGRSAISEGQLQRLLNEKFSNPILGLLGAHLLLAEPKPNLDLLSIVTTNVGYLLGEDFPDVVALRIALAQAKGAKSHDPTASVFPPLLRAGWNILSKFEAVMPRGSLNRIVATNTMDAGVWLSWLAHWPAADAAAAPRRARPKGSASRGSTDFAFSTPEAAGEHDSLDIASGVDGLPQTSSGPRSRARPPKRSSARASPESLATQISGLAKDVRWIEKLTVSRRGKGAGQVASLSGLPRSLLQTIQLVHTQLIFNDEFTAKEAQALCTSLGLPLAVVTESVTDLLRLAQPRE